ncbi:hypothetical protein YC2023_098475 [Brassica napus]
MSNILKEKYVDVADVTQHGRPSLYFLLIGRCCGMHQWCLSFSFLVMVQLTSPLLGLALEGGGQGELSYHRIKSNLGENPISDPDDGAVYEQCPSAPNHQNEQRRNQRRRVTGRILSSSRRSCSRRRVPDDEAPSPPQIDGSGVSEPKSKARSEKRDSDDHD